MRLIILGSKGFIGSKLAHIFRAEGNEVITLDNLDFMGDANSISIFDKIEIMINCIGSANVSFSFSNTCKDFNSNVSVVRSILDFLREHNLNHVKFINLSSAAVYGNPGNLPVYESDAIQPISPYGFHKFMSELLLKEYSHCFGLKTLSLRIFSAYGIGQKKLLLWDLHEKIQKSNDRIVLFGTGRESRDFIHIDDIGQQIRLAISKADFNGEALNVANGKEVTISEIVEMYQVYYPMKFDYEFNGEVRLGDPLYWCADISTIANWGYRQSVSMPAGIDNYIKHLFCE